jgi:hypothetical protein
MTDAEIPYVDLLEFNEKVAKYAETNFVLKALFSNPKAKVKTWEDLPPHLIQDLFVKLGCKPLIQTNKY